VEESFAEEVIKAMSNAKINDRKIVVERASERPSESSHEKKGENTYRKEKYRNNDRNYKKNRNSDNDKKFRKEPKPEEASKKKYDRRPDDKKTFRKNKKTLRGNAIPDYRKHRSA